MTRIAVGSTAAALVVALVLPGAAGAKGFKYGVTAGDVSSNSALIWTRSDKPAQLTLRVSTDKTFVSGVISRSLKSKSSRDNTVVVRVTKLKPGTRYFYRFSSSAGQSTLGQFETAPKPGQSKTIKFAWSGDADAQRAKGKKKPFFNNFEVYGRMAGEGNDFNINLGDTIYSDTDVGITITGGTQVHRTFPTALTLKQKWAKYRMNLALSNLQKVRRAAGMYNQWDDHEFIDDFTIPENGQALYKAGRNAFLDYMPARYTSKDGIARSFRWGKNAEFFFPDERSFRSAKARANHVCDNPETHVPDAAPMLPQDKRDFYALLIPSLHQPVSQACKDAITSAQRAFLGNRQLLNLEKALMQSTATFKIIVNETPILQQYAFPYDQWEGYTAERTKLLTFLKNHVKNVLFVSTDTHAVLVADARLKTFEPGGPVNTGIFDFVTGPVATTTWDREIAFSSGKGNGGDALRQYAYKPKPPDGIGMPCANLNVYSYTEVKVTSKAVTLTPKDLKGKQVQDKGKAPNPNAPKCGPFTVKAK